MLIGLFRIAWMGVGWESYVLQISMLDFYPSVDLGLLHILAAENDFLYLLVRLRANRDCLHLPILTSGTWSSWWFKNWSTLFSYMALIQCPQTVTKHPLPVSKIMIPKLVPSQISLVHPFYRATWCALFPSLMLSQSLILHRSCGQSPLWTNLLGMTWVFQNLRLCRLLVKMIIAGDKESPSFYYGEERATLVFVLILFFIFYLFIYFFYWRVTLHQSLSVQF